MAASDRAGEKLPLASRTLRLAGHAIEARVYAEDPRRDFLRLRDASCISRCRGVENVRVDTGVRSGDEITVHYDHDRQAHRPGQDRPAALERMRKALGNSRSRAS